MTKQETLQFIADRFTPAAYTVVKERHNIGVNDSKADPLVLELLEKASDIYDKAIKEGKTDAEAQTEAFEIFM